MEKSAFTLWVTCKRSEYTSQFGVDKTTDIR